MRVVPNKVIAGLLVVFSACFIVGVTQFSPVYFFVFLGFISYAWQIFYYSKVNIYRVELIVLFICVYLTYTQPISDIDGGIKDILLKIMELMVFCVTYDVLRKLELNSIVNLVKWFFNVSILLLFLDFLYRYHAGGGYSGLYSIKEHSLMFEDSNFVGIVCVSLLSLALFIRKEYNYGFLKQILSIIIFAILTFSRATIIACFISLLLYRFWDGKIRFYYFIVLCVLVIGAFILIISYFKTDPSFLLRLNIIDHILSFVNPGDGSFLYGWGLGNTKYFIGKSAHNFILSYLLEIGLIGLLSYIVLWAEFIRISRNVMYIMVPVFVNLMAVEGVMPYTYVCFAIVCALAHRKFELYESTVY